MIIASRYPALWSQCSAGQVVSNEPGFYKPEGFGIRIEGDMVSVPAETQFNFGSRPWLKFEYLSMVPISKDLIEPKMLSKEELEWLNNYHTTVYQKLLPRLSSEQEVSWLKDATSPLLP